MTKRSKEEKEMCERSVKRLLENEYTPEDGYTSTHLGKMIIESDKASDVGFIQRVIGKLRHAELDKIVQSNGNYKPSFFPAAKKIDGRFWRYFNAVKEPHYSDVMEIYYQRAAGMEKVARIMEMLKERRRR